MMEPKTALITGGSSGLGLAMAKELSPSYTPLLLARNSEKLEGAVAEFQSRGAPADSFSCDITDRENLERIREEIGEKYGTLDFLILNAGVTHVNLLEDSKIEDLREDIEIDLWGTILSAKTFLPLLKKGSKILIISSAFGLVGGAGYSAYCASKAGLINFAESLRRELLSRGISVHVACPADIDTPQYQRELEKAPAWMGDLKGRSSVQKPEVAARKILKKCRMGRFLIVTNFEVALLLFLSRILPRRIRDFLIDHMMPRP